MQTLTPTKTVNQNDNLEQHFYPPEQYLELEEKSELKHEYKNGEIITMTGGTTDHNEIAGNLCTYLKLALKNKKYRVFIADVRLWIPTFNLYTYPDLGSTKFIMLMYNWLQNIPSFDYEITFS